MPSHASWDTSLHMTTSFDTAANTSSFKHLLTHHTPSSRFPLPLLTHPHLTHPLLTHPLLNHLLLPLLPPKHIETNHVIIPQESSLSLTSVKAPKEKGTDGAPLAATGKHTLLIQQHPVKKKTLDYIRILNAPLSADDMHSFLWNTTQSNGLFHPSFLITLFPHVIISTLNIP